LKLDDFFKPSLAEAAFFVDSACLEKWMDTKAARFYKLSGLL